MYSYVSYKFMKCEKKGSKNSQEDESNSCVTIH